MKPIRISVILLTAFIFFFIPFKIAKADTKIWEAFAYHYYKSGKIDESVKEYKKILKDGQANFRVHYNLGVIYSENKNYRLAVRKFKIAAQKGSPVQEDALHNLIIIYGKYLKNKNKALEYHKKFREVQDKKIGK